MEQQKYSFDFQVFEDIESLNTADAALLQKAREITVQAYAPYSNFLVGAAALLNNNQIITGTNQENASYPVGICAERVLLAAVASLHPNMPIRTIAISYQSLKGKSNHPVSPCGMCRQSLVEYEKRVQQPIRLLLSGMQGKVIVIEEANALLPLSFSGNDLSK